MNLPTEVWVAIIGGAVSILGMIVKGVFTLWQSHKKPKESTHRKKQRVSFSLTAGLAKRLHQQRQEWQASRLYVSLLHNGSNFGIPGLHYEKLTVAFETTDHLTQPVYGVIKDYPVLQFAPLLELLHDDGRHHRSLHEEPEGSESRVYLEQNAVHDEFMAPITDDRGVTIGIIGASFHSRRAVWDENDWHTLESLSKDVTTALTRVADSGGSGVIDWS